jgi:hypothetical protein
MRTLLANKERDHCFLSGRVPKRQEMPVFADLTRFARPISRLKTTTIDWKTATSIAELYSIVVVRRGTVRRHRRGLPAARRALWPAFDILQAHTGDYTFTNMCAQSLDPFLASLAFLFALSGFGAKAGVFPLDVWLPDAHPVAPSLYAHAAFGGTRDEKAVGVMRQRVSAFGLPPGVVPSLDDESIEREQSFTEAVLRLAGKRLGILNRRLGVERR